MYRRFKSVVVLLVCIGLMQPAYALNGFKVTGAGTATTAMGGTGVVKPQDTGGLLSNPATVTYIVPRLDLAGQMAIVDAKKDTSNAANPSFKNSAVSDKSEAEIIWVPHMGFSGGQIKNSPLYYGFYCSGTSGLEVAFKHSRVTELATHDAFDKQVLLQVMEMGPVLGYKPTEKWSLGLSPAFEVIRFKSDMTNSTLSGMTVGNNNDTYSFGGGFNIGTTYDLTDKVSVGAVYKSTRWAERLHQYKDKMSERPNMPPECAWGIAYTPVKNLVLETNLKYIQWRSSHLFRNNPAQHGYGWRNQWVYSIGAQYTVFDRLSLRTGYNYGRSPIRENVVFANSLSPVIIEHHLSFGLAYDITEHWTGSMTWVHEFTNAMTDNGEGDVYSVRGKGTKISLGVDVLTYGLSYRF